MTRFRLLKRSSALLLAAACLGAAGCTHDDGTASLEASMGAPRVRTHAEVMALASARPSRKQPIAVLPPEAGAVRDVRVHDYVDGLRQDVALSGSAFAPVRNGITVLARTSAEPTLDERVPLARPTEAGIRSEIGAQFPHLAMQVVERPSSNSYGPYGLAIGRAGDDIRCLYAWQWVDANRMPPLAGVAGPVSLRVRLCQSGTSFDAMAALVDHLAIGGEPDARVATAEPAAIVAPPEAPRTIVHRRAHAGRGHHAHPPQSAHRREADPLAPTQAASSEPRYMTAASRVPAAPIAPSPAPTPFAADLPPQALLGPRTAPAAKAGSVAGVANPY